jgi:hypothetical protein
MKVICISNKLKYTGITIGKEYEIIPELLSQISDFYINDDIYHIRNNNGFDFYYPKEYFITIEEYRDKKLNELGI